MRSQRHLREIQGKDSADQELIDGVIVQEPAGPAVAFVGVIEDRSFVEDAAIEAFSVAGNFRGTDTPFTYAVQTGALPTGLSLDANTGVISGTPTTAGASTGIVIRATDATSADTADSNAFDITITAAP